MIPFIRPNIRNMAGYAPGEQPREGVFVKLNTNENPYPPSPRVVQAIEAALREDRLRKYPDPVGRHFCQVAGRVLGVDPDGILIGNGSDDILTILTRVFVPEGGLIVAPTPSYILYRSLAEIQGARYQEVSFTPGWGLPRPWPAREANLTFLPNPNSPSGTAIAPLAIEQFTDELGGPLILDEAYVDFAETDGLSLVESRNIIVTRTLSKSYSLAGIRFGFAVAKPTVVRELIKVKDSYNCDVLSLAAAAAALEDQDHRLATRARILATRTRMSGALARLGFAVTPSQANFVWCRRGDRPVKPIYEELKRRMILVRYMNYEGHGDGLRITVGSDAEVDRLIEERGRIL
ncbi:histidinol-phosphate aminotransferase [Planctomycetaceae bacterium SCGC AG-212-F19]|nr:histidinol-phosphate aminotransferase [Planctomycetaceae bacterium SCGC AG-212-F19]